LLQNAVICHEPPRFRPVPVEGYTYLG
jgi:hypothetical protein